MKFSIDIRVSRAAAVLALAALAAPAFGCMGAEKQLRAQKRSDSHVAFARRFMEAGRLPESLQQADMAVAAQRRNPEAWLVRGQVNFAQGEYAASIRDLDEALSLRQGYTEAYAWRAWARIESGMPEEAESDYREALKDRTYPGLERLHLNLGLLLIEKLGRQEEGILSLRRAVQMNPAYARGHYELGKALEATGDLPGARVSYEAALGGMKDSADLNLRLAVLLEKAGDPARAKAHFQRVIDINPSAPEAQTASEHLRRLSPPS